MALSLVECLQKWERLTEVALRHIQEVPHQLEEALYLVLAEVGARNAARNSKISGIE